MVGNGRGEIPSLDICLDVVEATVRYAERDPKSLDLRERLEGAVKYAIHVEYHRKHPSRFWKRRWRGKIRRYEAACKELRRLLGPSGLPGATPSVTPRTTPSTTIDQVTEAPAQDSGEGYQDVLEKLLQLNGLPAYAVAFQDGDNIFPVGNDDPAMVLTAYQDGKQRKGVVATIWQRDGDTYRRISPSALPKTQKKG